VQRELHDWGYNFTDAIVLFYGGIFEAVEHAEERHKHCELAAETVLCDQPTFSPSRAKGRGGLRRPLAEKRVLVGEKLQNGSIATQYKEMKFIMRATLHLIRRD
jgi:hypothetical protein